MAGTDSELVELCEKLLNEAKNLDQIQKDIAFTDLIAAQDACGREIRLLVLEIMHRVGVV